jgi:hypothetical protein
VWRPSSKRLASYPLYAPQKNTSLCLKVSHLSKDCSHGNADNKQCADPAQKLLAKHLPVHSLGEALHQTHPDNSAGDALAGTGGQTQPGINSNTHGKTAQWSVLAQQWMQAPPEFILEVCIMVDVGFQAGDGQAC